jgi:endonuclease/exonuclease/phosphatase family metal-dependent hydrolase
MKQSRSYRLGWVILCVVIAALSLWLPNVSKPGDSVEGCLVDCASTRPYGDGFLRVLSINVLHDYPHFDSLSQRLDLIAGEILRLDADIVLLQEVPWTSEIGHGAEALARKTGMNYVYLRANGNRNAIRFEEGEAILSIYPLSSPSFTELLPQPGFLRHRVALHAIASTPQGNLHLFVTHLSGEEAIGPGQVESLKEFTNSVEGPAILSGDFNALESSPQIVLLTGAWVDTYRTVHPNDVGFTSSVDDLHAGPEETLERRIDYIFASPGLELLDAQRIFDHPFQTDSGWLWASDHTGLLIVIGIK